MTSETHTPSPAPRRQRGPKLVLTGSADFIVMPMLSQV